MADKLTANCKSVVLKIREPRRLTTWWASAAPYRDSVTFSFAFVTIQLQAWSGPPLWSSVQSFWLQIQRSGFDSGRYQIFWEEAGLERGPLSLVNTTEELLGRKSSGSDLEIREYSRSELSRWPRDTLYPQKLALALPTNGGSSFGIVSSRTQVTKFSFL
jgi:hypothetical protein